jgi:predicted RNA-binding protein
MMKNYYCLITSDARYEIAYEIFGKRIKEKKYPLYLRTPHLNEIKEKDEVIFYIAGSNTNSQTFVASAEIATINNLTDVVVDPDKKKNVISKYLILEKILIFKEPKQIKQIIDKLKFIKNKKHYGTNLAGGVTKINREDLDIIKHM